MCKKGVLCCVLLGMWLCLSGFTTLGNEGEGTLGALLGQLSAEDVESIMAADEWAGRVMAKVDDSVSVRESPGTESAVIGKMFKGDAGEIIEQADGWTRIQSGDVNGWVSDEFLAFGEEAEARAAQGKDSHGDYRDFESAG